jgi:DNA modification methylase
MDDHRYSIIEGDCIKGMKTLPDGCIHTCITSPPYWGLRDYGHDDQLGAEKTPDEFVDNMVKVFREVRRVLRDDGTVWLNLGDSYWSNTLSRKDPVESMWGNRPASDLSDGRDNIPKVNKRGGLGAAPEGIKPKDLVGIPWHVAFALQADGWYLRQDIIWHKPNPMPEAVMDRCTKAHEYIFLLAKSQRYYYDHEAIREDGPTYVRKASGYKSEAYVDGHTSRTGGKNHKSGFADKDKVTVGRNKRSVWTVTTKPFRGAHFATFPKDLIEPCVLAGTSAHGCCSKCGAPWARDVEVGISDYEKYGKLQGRDFGSNDSVPLDSGAGGQTRKPNGTVPSLKAAPRTLKGWIPTCKCDGASVVPCTVFDPFTGSGTTCVVALNNNRRFVGTELNPDYIKIATDRIADEAPMSLMDVMQ